MSKILVADGVQILNEELCFSLQNQGHEPISVIDLKSAEPIVKSQNFIY